MACLQLTCTLTLTIDVLAVRPFFQFLVFRTLCGTRAQRWTSPWRLTSGLLDVSIFGIFTEKHLISDVESYQKLCTLCIPETLAETLYPVMSRRVDRYLDQALAAVVKKTVVPAPGVRSKALAVHKMLANLIGWSSRCKWQVSVLLQCQNGILAKHVDWREKHI